jgi:hypothetical protein
MPDKFPPVDTEQFELGRKQGRLEGFQEVLSLLETKYMSDDIEPKTPEAEAILTLVSEVGKALATSIIQGAQTLE